MPSLFQALKHTLPEEGKHGKADGLYPLRKGEDLPSIEKKDTSECLV